MLGMRVWDDFVEQGFMVRRSESPVEATGLAQGITTTEDHMAIIVDSAQIPSQPGRAPGITVQRLLGSGSDIETVAVTMLLLTLEPGAELPLHTHVTEEAFFVLEGTGQCLSVDGKTQSSLGWL